VTGSRDIQNGWILSGQPSYDNEKENWRIMTNKEIYAMVKKTDYNKDNKIT
jgi:hypothetical protein